MLFRGKILGEQTNPKKLHRFALKLVKERDNCASSTLVGAADPLHLLHYLSSSLFC
jgi:hypothetical protein